MYLEQPPTKEALLKIIRSITHCAALQDDLLQEAMIHLWLMETRRPDQTKSWYLQSCKYHLLHYLSAGRSIDSSKRRNGQLAETEIARWFEESEQVDADAAVFAAVCARDLIALLGKHLAGPERAVLNCLAEGLGAREIGRQLGISHSMAIKHRRKIAALLTRLQKAPLRGTEKTGTNGHGFPARANHVNGTNGAAKMHRANGSRQAVCAAPHLAGDWPRPRASVVPQSEPIISLGEGRERADAKEISTTLLGQSPLDIRQNGSLMAAYD
jgi:RNA polymerase sigma factor (sigma-70 family)